MAGAVVSGITYAIWPKGVPRAVARLRWLIAFAIGILLIAIKISIGIDTSGTVVNAGVMWLIAENLRSTAA